MKLRANWSVFSKYRDELFGVAIIQIIVLHFFMNYYSSPGKTFFLKRYLSLIQIISALSV